MEKESVTGLRPLEARQVRTWSAAVLTAGVAVGLVGCDNIQQQFDTGMQFLRDEQTGCQYARTVGSSYLTPRLGKDGKPMCGAP